MTREEILERMARGAEYLERDDLTADQREKALKRYQELEAMLEQLNAEENGTQVPDKVKECIAKIREILGMNGEGRKRLQKAR